MKAKKRRDLSDLVGTWKPDRALEEAIADQDRVDPELLAMRIVLDTSRYAG
jgi:hypothetical protein